MASTTKIMTAILVLEKMDLSDCRDRLEERREDHRAEVLAERGRRTHSSSCCTP